MTYATYDDNRYPYGTATRYYGVPVTTPTTKLWSILIDWDNDGIFDSNEARYTIGLETDRGFNDVYSSGRDGMDRWGAPAFVGTATITLKNTNGRFSAWSTASGSLGFNIAPGRKVCIMVREGYSGTDKKVFTGFTKTIKENRRQKTVVISCVDGIEYLQEHESRVPINTSIDVPTSAGDALAALASSCGYPFQSPDLLGANADLPYYYYEGKALPELVSLASQDGSMIFIAANGGIKTGNFFNVGSSSNYDADVFGKEVEMSMPWENIKTKVKRYFESIQTGTANSEIWNLGSVPLRLPSATTTTIFVDYNFENQAVAASPDTPVSGTDFIVKENADGTGATYTGDCTMTVTDYTTYARLDYFNNSGFVGYLTTSKLRGTPYLVTENFRTVQGTDYLNVGEKVLVTETRNAWKAGGKLPYNDADVFYTYMGYPQCTKTINVTLDNRTQQFEHDLFDQITFNITNPDIQQKDWSSGQYYNVFKLFRIQHRWISSTGQATFTKWTLRHIVETTAPTDL